MAKSSFYSPLRAPSSARAAADVGSHNTAATGHEILAVWSGRRIAARAANDVSLGRRILPSAVEGPTGLLGVADSAIEEVADIHTVSDGSGVVISPAPSRGPFVVRETGAHSLALIPYSRTPTRQGSNACRARRGA